MDYQAIAAVCIAVLALMVSLFVLIRRPRTANVKLLREGDTADADITAAEDEPLVRFNLLDADAARFDSQIPISSGLRTLLNEIPRAMVATATASGKSIELVLSPQLQRGLAEGRYFLGKSKEVNGAYRINVQSRSNGQFVGQGQVAPKASPVAIAAAAWQIAAVITAQKFLADINANLAVIKRDVRDIQQWLENQLWGRLEGNYGHLLRMSDSIGNAGIGDDERNAFVTTLEQVEREMRQAMAEIKLHLKVPLKHLHALDVSAPYFTSGLREKADELISHIAKYHGLCRAYLVAGAVRTTALGLRAALGLSSAHVERALGDLTDEIADFKCQKVEDLTSCTTPKIEGLKATFSDSDDDAKQQRRALDHLSEYRIWYVGAGELLDRCNSVIRRLPRATEDEANMRLLVSFDKDGIASHVAVPS